MKLAVMGKGISYVVAAEQTLPLIAGKGRASVISEELQEQIAAYQRESFFLWLKADESAQIELR